VKNAEFQISNADGRNIIFGSFVFPLKSLIENSFGELNLPIFECILK